MDPMQLIDHPPQDPERRADPAFAAAVMARVREPRPARAGAAWWLGGAVIAAAALATPGDLLSEVSAAGISDWFDLQLLIEAALAAAAVAIACFVATRTRTTP